MLHFIFSILFCGWVLCGFATFIVSLCYRSKFPSAQNIERDVHDGSGCWSGLLVAFTLGPIAIVLLLMDRWKDEDNWLPICLDRIRNLFAVEGRCFRFDGRNGLRQPLQSRTISRRALWTETISISSIEVGIAIGFFSGSGDGLELVYKRLELRQLEAVPIRKVMEKWLELDSVKAVLSKSSFGETVTYLRYHSIVRIGCF